MANATVPGCGFHHVAMKVKDFDAAVRFYTEGLGCAETLAWGEGDGRAVMLDFGDGGCMEIFAGGEDTAPEGRLMHIALATTDTDAAFARAVAAGATPRIEPKDVDIQARTGVKPVRIAFVAGPLGEVIEFFQDR